MLLPSQSGFGAAEPVGSPAWGTLDASYWTLSLSSLINQSLSPGPNGKSNLTI